MNFIDFSCFTRAERSQSEAGSLALKKASTPANSPGTKTKPLKSFSTIANECDGEDVVRSGERSRRQEVTGPKPFKLWEKEGFTFGDMVDIINPLQHIPIIATLYRNMTDDKIGFLPRVIGGALWGRVGGFVSGLVNAVVEWFTGKDIGDHVYSAFFKKSDESEVAIGTGNANKLRSVSSVGAPPNFPDNAQKTKNVDAADEALLRHRRITMPLLIGRLYENNEPPNEHLQTVYLSA